ncbi:hypothetical protein DIPPA_16442 [Diplonema papillatum]|nr:hypothetical protein DIPPA_16442 [Diplonema papillatum]
MAEAAGGYECGVVIEGSCRACGVKQRDGDVDEQLEDIVIRHVREVLAVDWRGIAPSRRAEPQKESVRPPHDEQAEDGLGGTE